MKTRADFMKDANKGMMLKLVMVNGQTLDQVLQDDPEMSLHYTRRMNDYANRFRKVTKVQSNAILIEGSRLDIPNAKQVEYDGKTLKLYRIGYRELNERERAAMDEWIAITKTEKYQKDAEYDALTDYSGTFYQKKHFFSDKGLSYLSGFESDESDGMLYRNFYCDAKGDRIEGEFIRDTSIRGILAWEYEIKGVE